MRPVQGLSYPRSGHAIAYAAANRYFGADLVYCDPFNSEHCGCGRIPCVNPNRNFAKFHDFELANSAGTTIFPQERYFIQYRNPVRSIVSNYYLYLIDHPGRTGRSDWREFALSSIDYWNRFIDKWVLEFPADFISPVYCPYEILVSEPESRLPQLLALLSEEPINNEKIGHIIKAMDIRPRCNLERFGFFDRVFFREMEAATAGRIARLGLPSFEDNMSL